MRHCGLHGLTCNGCAECLTWGRQRWCSIAGCRDLAAKSEGLLSRVDTAVELQRQANQVLTHILGARYTLGALLCMQCFPMHTSLQLLCCLMMRTMTRMATWVTNCNAELLVALAFMGCGAEKCSVYKYSMRCDLECTLWCEISIAT
jgi:hypothetical protein